MFVNSSSSSSSRQSGTGAVERRGLLVSRPLSVSPSSRRPAQCLRLAYHLTGDQCSLAVSVLSVDRSRSSVWSRGCDPTDESWHELELSLSKDKPFQVRTTTIFSCLLLPDHLTAAVHSLVGCLQLLGAMKGLRA